MITTAKNFEHIDIIERLEYYRYQASLFVNEGARSMLVTLDRLIDTVEKSRLVVQDGQRKIGVEFRLDYIKTRIIPRVLTEKREQKEQAKYEKAMKNVDSSD